MRFFKRSKRSDPISAFWQWWTAEGADRTAAALAASQPQRTAAELSERVGAIAPGLAWELSWGRVSQHTLVVSGDGDPQLWPLARRWRLAAPAADPVWEYSDFGLPVPQPENLAIEVDHHTVDVATAVVGIGIHQTSMDVALHHPTFADMDELTRNRLAFLLLDKVLGEATVETWINQITAVGSAPEEPWPLTQLPDLLDRFTSTRTNPDGEPTWAVVEGEGQHGPLIAVVQIPLRPAFAPHLDTHVGIAVAFAEVNENGFAGPRSEDALGDLKDHLDNRIGDAGRMVAMETTAGVRVHHYYVDGTGPAAEQLRAAVGGWDQGPVRFATGPDPAWDAVSHLRT